MKKIIFMDIDDTLLDFNKCSKVSIIQSCEKFNIEYKDLFYTTFLRINDSLWKQIERNEITKEELFSVRWAKIFEELHVNFDGPTFENEFISRLDFIAEPVDGAKELLLYLSKKADIYLTTNAPYSQQESRLKIAHLLQYTKKIYASGNIGYAKPDIRFFEYCMKDIDAKKEDIIIIGDSYTADIQGGLNSGIDTLWFNPKNMDCLGKKPTYEVSCLLDICDIL